MKVKSKYALQISMSVRVDWGRAGQRRPLPVVTTPREVTTVPARTATSSVVDLVRVTRSPLTLS